MSNLQGRRAVGALILNSKHLLQKYIIQSTWTNKNHNKSVQIEPHNKPFCDCKGLLLGLMSPRAPRTRSTSPSENSALEHYTSTMSLLCCLLCSREAREAQSPANLISFKDTTNWAWSQSPEEHEKLWITDGREIRWLRQMVEVLL